MLRVTDLLTYYNVWVNGETLPRRHLFANRPPRPTTVVESNPSTTQDGDLKFALPQANSVLNVDLRVDGSKLMPIHQILLHGSQATRDTCGFSDVDVVVVLDNSRTFTAAQHQDAVAELRVLLRKMFLYDCLMHHGFMFMLRSWFEAYRESFLPVAALRNAVVIWGPSSIGLTKVAPSNSKQRLRDSARSLAHRFERRDHERDDYAFKSVLSGLLLMPCLLLESVGIYCYKRDSFVLGPQAFPTIAWEAIRQAEDLRLRWERTSTNITQSVVARVFHPHAIIRLSRVYRSRTNVRKLLRDRPDALTATCQEFLHCITSL